MPTKHIAQIERETSRHWVGDGFPVRNIFSYDTLGTELSPFLLLDYAGPADFDPTTKSRGVGTHPHRGFETVTIVYQGDVTHQDNAGNAGTIGPGDVQWMTAAKGILHEEIHGPVLKEHGGTLEMVQLWVNLPAKDKMSSPRYQDILNANIPAIPLDNNAGAVRVIAGEFHAVRGPAKTFTPIHLWDVKIQAGHGIDLPFTAGFTTAILTLNGKVTVNDRSELQSAELALFEREGDTVHLHAHEDTSLLVLHGEPIAEPIVGRGPFVMNTQEEIRQAANDFNAGLF
ncbi:pirin family protein [Nitrospira sp. M1]